MKDLNELTRQALAGIGVDLIDVERAPLGLLRVTIDHPDGVRVEHCEQVSHQLSRVYEVEGIDYRRLEVGSPGVDRPLRTKADFVRFVGERIEVKFREPIEGQRVFKGILRVSGEQTEPGLNDQFEVESQVKKGEVQRTPFTVADVERAKLDPLLDFKGKKR
jgi:ribosome maturation factor RimP